MKSQSTVVRDLTEPGWREREAGHVVKFIAAIPLVGTEGAQFKPSFGDVVAENKRLRDELRNIADANPRNWDAPFSDTTSFQAWAQSRARAALGETE